MTDTHDGSTRKPTRRTVVKGAAWAVPAITVATAAPAYAASPPPPPVIQFGSSQLCKLPGNSVSEYCYTKGYVAFLVFDNTANSEDYYLCDVTDVITDGNTLTVAGISDASGACGTFTNCITIPGGGMKTVAVWTNAAKDSSGGTFDVYFTGSFVGCGTCAAEPKQTGDLVGASWTINDQGQSGGSCKVRPSGCTAPPSLCA